MLSLGTTSGGLPAACRSRYVYIAFNSTVGCSDFTAARWLCYGARRALPKVSSCSAMPGVPLEGVRDGADAEMPRCQLRPSECGLQWLCGGSRLSVSQQQTEPATNSTVTTQNICGAGLLPPLPACSAAIRPRPHPQSNRTRRVHPSPSARSGGLRPERRSTVTVRMPGANWLLSQSRQIYPSRK